MLPRSLVHLASQWKDNVTVVILVPSCAGFPMCIRSTRTWFCMYNYKRSFPLPATLSLYSEEGTQHLTNIRKDLGDAGFPLNWNSISRTQWTDKHHCFQIWPLLTLPTWFLQSNFSLDTLLVRAHCIVRNREHYPYTPHPLISAPPCLHTSASWLYLIQHQVE